MESTVGLLCACCRDEPRGHVTKLNSLEVGKLNVERVVMRREKHAAAAPPTHHAVEHSVCDRIAVKRACASSEFVKYDERVGRRLSQDAGALGALYHEGGLPQEDAVCGADARVNRVNGGQRESKCGGWAADLCHDGGNTHSPQESGFSSLHAWWWWWWWSLAAGVPGSAGMCSNADVAGKAAPGLQQASPAVYGASCIRQKSWGDEEF
jgi:hypothetical protein